MKLNMKLLDRVRLIKDVQGQEHIPIEVANLRLFLLYKYLVRAGQEHQSHALKTDTM